MLNPMVFRTGSFHPSSLAIPLPQSRRGMSWVGIPYHRWNVTSFLPVPFPPLQRLCGTVLRRASPPHVRRKDHPLNHYVKKAPPDLSDLLPVSEQRSLPLIQSAPGPK